MPPTPARTLPILFLFVCFYYVPIPSHPIFARGCIFSHLTSTRSNPLVDGPSLFIYSSLARKKMLSRISISHTASLYFFRHHICITQTSQVFPFLVSIIPSVSIVGAMHLLRPVTFVTYWLAATPVFQCCLRCPFACLFNLGFVRYHIRTWRRTLCAPSIRASSPLVVPPPIRSTSYLLFATGALLLYI